MLTKKLALKVTTEIYMNYTLLITLLALNAIPASFGVTQQEKLNRKLLKAVCQNNHAQVLMLLKSDADINTHDNWTTTKNYLGYTPLHYTVHYNYIKLAQLLLDFGAQVNSTDNRQRTPLHYAARDHKFVFAQLLLLHKAFIDTQNADGETPLHLTFYNSPSFTQAISVPTATTFAHYETVELLLSYGTNVNVQSKNGYTPLHHAAALGLSSIVELLLVYGADATLQDNSGVNALFYTIDSKTILLLLNFGATDKGWMHPENSASAILHSTFNKAFIDAINPLVDIKAYYESQKTRYQDLLAQAYRPTRKVFTKAIKKGYYTLVKLCIRNGIQVTVDDLLLTKLHYKIYKKQNSTYRHTYRAIGQLLFTYLQLLGIYYSHSATSHHLLSRIISRIYAPKKSLIGPIAKQGIIGSNYFTEDIVRNIARYV